MFIVKNYYSRFFLLILSSIAFLNTNSCQNIKSPSNNSGLVNQSDDIVLEVYTESKYNVYPPGKVLNLRIYVSGKVEYDYYLSQEARKPFTLFRKEVQLSVDELAKVKELLNDSTLMKAKEMYSPTVLILDASITVFVTCKIGSDNEKKIVLNENHSNLILEKKEGVYPKGLLNLLLFVQNTNTRLLKEGQ
jgi:hypothetical protein